jgi:hypothetical protein
MAASTTRKDAKFCEAHLATVKKTRGKVKPKDEDDHQVLSVDGNLSIIVPKCFMRAGDCQRAWVTYKEFAPLSRPDVYEGKSQKEKDELFRITFDSIFEKCKGKGT